MIELVEVSPRDGLQNEKAILPTADKVSLVTRAVAAGARRVEVASFVHPLRVPQMADAEAVIAALPRIGGVRYIGLVLNKRGALRALASAVDEIGIVCVASDPFGLANQAQTSDESVSMALDVLALARQSNRATQVTIAVAFGCPFGGAVDPARIIDIARRLASGGPVELTLADTIGVARPSDVSRLVKAVAAAVSPLPVRAHFHDTRGMGVANAMAAVAAGAVTVDAAIGGVGGCPFAPGAAGNVASEDVAYAFGADMGIDIQQIVDTAYWLNGRLGRTSTSAMMRASPKPAQEQL